jgi:hypothetical protein
LGFSQSHPCCVEVTGVFIQSNYIYLAKINERQFLVNRFSPILIHDKNH